MFFRVSPKKVFSKHPYISAYFFTMVLEVLKMTLWRSCSTLDEGTLLSLCPRFRSFFFRIASLIRQWIYVYLTPSTYGGVVGVADGVSFGAIIAKDAATIDATSVMEQVRDACVCSRCACIGCMGWGGRLCASVFVWTRVSLCGHARVCVCTCLCVSVRACVFVCGRRMADEFKQPDDTQRCISLVLYALF